MSMLVVGQYSFSPLASLLQLEGSASKQVLRQLYTKTAASYQQTNFIPKWIRSKDLFQSRAEGCRRPNPAMDFLIFNWGTCFFFPGLQKSSFPHSSGGMVWWETRTGCPALAMLCQPKRLPKHRGFSSKKVTVDLQVDEIYELSRRRDVVWATFSFRFDNQPGVRLLSARPKALGCLVCSERDGE